MNPNNQPTNNTVNKNAPKLHTHLPGKPRFPRVKKNTNENTNDEGYNSEDEYTEVRPRVSMKPVDEHALQYVTPEELAKKLATKGLHITRVGKDGNCLFRAVAHQLYGDQEMHDAVRRQCMDYMEQERDHFSQFVTEEFSEYIARKRKDAVYGNHLELQAIAELYNRPILIYTINEEAINLFQEEYKTDNPPMQLSYHYGNHYNSVYNPKSPTFGVGVGLPGVEQGADRKVVKRAIKESEQNVITQQFVKQAMQESEENIFNQQVENQVMQESEQNVINQQLENQIMQESEQSFLNDIKLKSERDEIEAQMLRAQLNSTTVDSPFDLDTAFAEEQYLAMLDAELIDQIKKDSWSDY